MRILTFLLVMSCLTISRLNDKGTNTNGCMKNKDDNDNSMVISLIIITKSNKVGVTFSKIIKYLIMVRYVCLKYTDIMYVT